MQTCVLIPPELCLILTPCPDPRRPLEMGVTVWASVTLRPGTVLYPDQGRIRLDRLETYSVLPRKDVSRTHNLYSLSVVFDSPFFHSYFVLKEMF